MTSPINAMENQTLDQTDFLKLFVQELSYQDPMQPLDNREFMTQMAQFSSLQEVRTTNDLLAKLLNLTSANQSLELLGKVVSIKNSEQSAKVRRIHFEDEQGPQLSLENLPGSWSLNDVREVFGS